ncbi:MAG: hypothetical protein TEF_14895 [Rhizobiales bacterium NRL2]|jgi:hypothetical protein|nr:MAG: hypothetical protein TEF_14895 [Rhizobiales bacterium NRL2]
MNTPVWTKPALFGAAGGAALLALVGFAWAGWETGGSAEQMAAQRAHAEVVAALVPFCVQNAGADPQRVAVLTRMKEAPTYSRAEMLMESGWATMPGDERPDRSLANACLDRLATEF